MFLITFFMFMIVEWHFKVVPVISSPEPIKAEEEYYLCFFTASWCGPCQQFKRSGRLEEITKELSVTTVDMDASPEWWKSRIVKDSSGNNVTLPGVKSIPSFWLCRKSDRWPVKRWTGSISLQSLNQEITKRKSVEQLLPSE